MDENTIAQFFRKIHLLIFDSKFLVSQVLTSTLGKILTFFLTLFFLSLVLSSVSRVIKISEFAPNLIYSAVGTMKFENYVLTCPDTLKQIDKWKFNELTALISGVKVPQSFSYSIEISMGSDRLKNPSSPFLHIGKTEFSTNVMSVGWNKILKKPNMTIDENFYKTYFKNPLNRFGIFLAEILIIGLEMLKSIFQIWLSILIYLLFFGKRLKFPEKFKLITITAIPYLIIMPISLFAAKSILFTTDISLLCAVVIAIRAIFQIEKNYGEGIQ